MKVSLLEWIICPACGSSLNLEAETSKPDGNNNVRDSEQEIYEALLLCRECGHWYPVHESIPELYPDFLRNRESDLAFLRTMKSRLRWKLYRSLIKKTKSSLNDSPQPQEQGITYKQAEMAIKTRVEDPLFFNPGLFSPFNPGNPEFTGQLIRRFGNTIPLLELKIGGAVADIGAGYAWTTEWLKKMGITAIGVDICRTYLEIGLQRMKESSPHLILADVEHLPLKTGSLDAFLCFDAFHHIYDRKAAMSHFGRVLKEGGNVTLAEPGPDHESAEASQEVMKKYGILERGMSLDDLTGYIQGLDFCEPEEHAILDITSLEKEEPLTEDFIRSHAYADCRFYRIKKSA
jgi:SAM-dependent methyltransferase